MTAMQQARFLVWTEGNDTCTSWVEEMWQQSTSKLLAELRVPDLNVDDLFANPL
jgi:hypothetical protein